MKIFRKALQKALGCGSFALLWFSNTWAQPYFAPCPTDTAVRWTECTGSLDKDGNKYTGEFVNNLFNGKGVYWFSDGDYYNGTFKNGVPEGWGVYVFLPANKLNGHKYIGDFENGRAHGRGTIFFQNGAIYAGQFVAGLPDGSGLYLDKEGVLLQEGIWREGKFITPSSVVFQSGSDTLKAAEQQKHTLNTEIDRLKNTIKEQKEQLEQPQLDYSKLQQSIQLLEAKHAQQLSQTILFYMEKVSLLEAALAKQQNLEKQLQIELEQLRKSLFSQANFVTSNPSTLKPEADDGKLLKNRLLIPMIR